MSLLQRMINKAAASAAAIAVPHENPAPVDETSVAHVQPAPPAAESSFDKLTDGHAKQQIDVLRNLPRTQPTKQQREAGLDMETRRAIANRFLAQGPPADSFSHINFPDQYQLVRGMVQPRKAKPVERVASEVGTVNDPEYGQEK